jgi:hypothetical protein
MCTVQDDVSGLCHSYLLPEGFVRGSQEGLLCMRSSYEEWDFLCGIFASTMKPGISSKSQVFSFEHKLECYSNFVYNPRFVAVQIRVVFS